ncbi:oligopeptide/dipeptide ABC transporter ATP-binding protein [Roseiarcus fermentans]|uniref:Oligopeptide/dipeptide ABC transporter ATP-binding protein n=1 Tax=Roseiarcus fermentans TaxID=1473586 RepID=A0A366FKT1_9HYPH|nr:ABC transporter ATP-binding protein [Roseiarcus fermentans]RBP14319.1 oligopeptide/dipeptide ABC transporter ATP-binding protein [Roseiarcus fermentans]
MTAEPAVLAVSGLTVTYPRGFGRPPLTAVADVSFTVGRGETVSIVGESGSGKTTIGSAILGLQPAAKGEILLHGVDIAGMSRRQRSAFRETLQAVFQDPFSSLDPSKSIGDAVGEPLRVAAPKLGSEAVRRRAAEALTRVGLDPAVMRRFPAEFSGGQRQRIAIARALILKPAIVVCDEAVSALDVSVQAQVLNLLEELQREEGVSYIFISHNMAAVRHISDRIVVLYRGRVMEDGSAEAVCDRPAHPYTRSLLASVPLPDVRAQRERRRVRALTIAPARNAATPSTGCPFAPRCPFAADICVAAPPPLIETGDGRRVACVRIADIPPADDLASLELSGGDGR